MRSRTRLAIAVIAACGAFGAAEADAAPNQWPLNRAMMYNWHANYAYHQYGQPLALVVPPTANLQTNWGWGVSSSRVSHLDHQFGRNYAGPGPHGGPFRPAPVWPQDTTHFGVYNVRGPW